MRIDCYIHLVNDESVLQQILHKVTRIMATQAELAADDLVPDAPVTP